MELGGADVQRGAAHDAVDWANWESDANEDEEDTVEEKRSRIAKCGTYSSTTQIIDTCMHNGYGDGRISEEVGKSCLPSHSVLVFGDSDCVRQAQICFGGPDRIIPTRERVN
eukprot:5928308-Pyramimonas_sp.AAC.2